MEMRRFHGQILDHLKLFDPRCAVWMPPASCPPPPATPSLGVGDTGVGLRVTGRW